ncbi:hypothetical protein ABZ766_21210 [Streptomyces sp. NPDC006670]|uniref:hypothetical protein n=1 Tax=Streptomyces sp. NPDC006670 TaxID=3154476 RepID=UPI0033F04294
MSFPRVRIASVLAALTAGATTGALGALAGKLDGVFFHALSLVFSAGWSWACLAFLVGYFRPSKAEAGLLASVALALGVIVYYSLKALSPVTPIGVPVPGEPSGGNAWSGIVVWGALAFLLGAPVGILGNMARVPGIAGLPFRLLVPLIAFFETSWRLAVEAAAAGPAAESTWATIRVVSALAAVALAGRVLWGWCARHHSAKFRARSD